MVASEHPPSEPTVLNDFSRHPPVENFHTIDGLLRSHAAEPQQKPLVCYPVNAVSDFEEHTAAEIGKYADQAAQFYIGHGLQPAVCMSHSWLFEKPSSPVS